MKFKRNIVVVLVHFDGTVGKTTLADHTIAPRLGGGTPQLKKLRIETLNSGGIKGDGTKEVDSDKLNGIAVAIVAARGNVVLDIGSSNINNVIPGLRKLEGFSERITHWLVPATPDRKVHEGTLATVNFLLSLGVAPETITVLPNRISAQRLTTDFSQLQDAITQQRVQFCQIGIEENDVFKLLSNRTIAEVVEDRTNYDDLIAELTDDEIDAGAGEEYAQNIVTRMLALAVNRQMDDAFRWIFADDLVEA